MTVSPDTAIARPDVRAALAIAWCGSAPRPFFALAAQEEQRVVDANRHADEQNHRGGLRADRQPVAGDGQQPSRGERGGEGEQHRDARGDQRAEHADEQDQGERQ
jgi:hypothetical protein